MKNVKILFLIPLVFSCAHSKIEGITSCKKYLTQIKKNVTAEKGRLYSESIDLSLWKNKDCFIGKNVDYIIELLGSPLRDIDTNIQPLSISYTHNQGCIHDKKFCKQIFFIFNNDKTVKEIKEAVF